MKLGLGCRLGALFAVLLGALSIGVPRADVIFVTNAFNNTIGEYNATTGAVVNPALVSGLDGPAFIATKGQHPPGR
jgi:hypothetical protein